MTTRSTRMTGGIRRWIAAALLGFVLLVGLAEAASAGYRLCAGLEREGPPVGHLYVEECVPLP